MFETKAIWSPKTGLSFAWLAVFVAVMFLSGCGGGGGGGGGGLIGLPLPTTTPGAGGGQPVGAVALSGKATYESVPNPNGTLVYASAAPKPVRGAMLEVIDPATSAQLATTTTDENGAYAVSVPPNTTVAVRVRAQLTRTGAGGSWDVTVRDNTRSNALYTVQSNPFSSGMGAMVQDVHASSGWGGSAYTETRAAAPFAILDAVYTAMQKVRTVAPDAAFPVLRVYWSANNAPSSGSIAAGQIGTTFFVNRSTGREIYVLGKEDVDTDEYDSSVITHEWGHYYQSAFSRDDSTGGSHSLTQSLDRRLAFSEGWGNAWSGIALARQNYTDSGGAQQADSRASIGFDLSTRIASATPGWFNESSIQSIFWNLHRQVGFKPIHDTLTGSQFKGAAAVTSIHPFAAAFNAVAPAQAGTLAALLTGESISAAGDPFGNGETNDGGVPVALPMYRLATVGTPAQACVSSTAGTGNKLGNFSYLRFTAPESRNYQFSFSGGPAGAIYDFDVFRGGRLPRGGGNTVQLSAGEQVLAVTITNNSAPSACFDVTIQ
ncbi:hypothetical protein M2165_001578 [Variovorax sp. TBS-050B]|uniref:hypothetical protein n=1 Tax=Variovorax sp. TBS-050B TaxID=2940551 RepID=UPI002476907E|nr:hypothetical protein [Variovorax sp. TBS-050B]MDH6591689.1 hypothetical protein [Variovorax sp. TBS-050B]